jgi:energy-coupling factor transport system permease protein
VSAFHTGAWTCWLAAALAPPLLTRNPIYLAAALAAIGAVYLALGRGGPGTAAAGWGAFLRLGLIVVAVSTLIQPLVVHQGATLLFTLPSWTWTAEALGRTLGTIEIGGRVTLESVVYGAGRGLALLAVLLAFAAFNARVDPYQLLRRVPRFLYRSGIVLSIALAFVPQMLAAQREIREAQALRGHRFRGVRDLVPLLVALLAEGLERSIDLAESMEARGFGAGSPTAGGAGADGRPPLSVNALHAALATALALLLAGAGVRAFYPGAAAGWLALAAGALLLAASLAAVGRRVRRSRFRREPWRRRDTALAACSIAAFAAFAAAWLIGRPTLLFYPYPLLPAPPFHPALGIALALLAAPALAARIGRGDAPSPP